MQRGLNTPTYISKVKYCLKKSVLQPISAKIGILCTGYDLCGVGGVFRDWSKSPLIYQVCEGTCEEEKALACLSEVSSQLDLDSLLPISTKPHRFWEWESVLQHAANKHEIHKRFS